MKKQANAITLIALIITIIVLLILSGVVIYLTMGENGIIGKVQTAVGKYENAQNTEEIQIAKFENETEKHISGNRDYETEINLLKAEIEKLKNANSYSTDEIVCGTWINGKPLYKKTFTGLQLSNTSSTDVNLTSLNIDACVYLEGMLSGSSDFSGGWPIPGVYVSTAGGSIAGCVQTTFYRDSLSVKPGNGGWANYKATVTIEYTKTTDKATE